MWLRSEFIRARRRTYSLKAWHRWATSSVTACVGAARLLPKQFPTAADVIDSNFDFAQRILANQREFAQRIAEARRPLVKP